MTGAADHSRVDNGRKPGVVRQLQPIAGGLAAALQLNSGWLDWLIAPLAGVSSVVGPGVPAATVNWAAAEVEVAALVP